MNGTECMAQWTGQCKKNNFKQRHSIVKNCFRLNFINKVCFHFLCRRCVAKRKRVGCGGIEDDDGGDDDKMKMCKLISRCGGVNYYCYMLSVKCVIIYNKSNFLLMLLLPESIWILLHFLPRFEERERGKKVCACVNSVSDRVESKLGPGNFDHMLFLLSGLMQIYK